MIFLYFLNPCFCPTDLGCTIHAENINFWELTDYDSVLDLQPKQNLETLQILSLDTQGINLDFSSSTVEDWTLTNSFHAAYVSWYEWNTVGAAQRENQLEKEFDYDEFPLEEFYNLYLESSLNFQTAKIQHETIIGIQLNKNIFGLTGQFAEQEASLGYSSLVLQPPYITSDFMSKKNYLGLYIEHEALISDRLSGNFEGTLDIAIPDTTDFGETSLIDPIENTNFFPEISLGYQLSDAFFAYASFEYSAESIDGLDFRNEELRSEVYQTWEVGIETKLNENWFATVSFAQEIQNNITTTNPNQPDFDLQIDRQIGNFWTGEISGQLNPGWWLYGFYTFADATVTKDEVIAVGNSIPGIANHSGGLWTSYELTQGKWQGLGLGGGFFWNGDRAGDVENSFELPDYLQTDLAIFYNQDRFKATISLQNLFNAGIEDEDITPQTILATFLWKF
ncbi:MAG: TonB-dependent receptor [Cyanobacteria bacterium P01_F01_bin.143]